MTVKLERPSMRWADEFLGAVRRSRSLHRNRVTPPATLERYKCYLRHSRRMEQANFLVIVEGPSALAGVVNIGAIVRGYFQSAPLGYYAFLPSAGSGFMREGVRLAIQHAFRRLKLHRLEANIQPDNQRSIALVKSLGFRLEGYSPRYLKICGRWRDHERWALLAEEWSPRRADRRKSHR